MITGQGGSGKSCLLHKIEAATRARDLIAITCSSTGLSALNVNGITAHDLTKFPVVEEEDVDESTPLECQLDARKNKDRKELLLETTVICWDEFPSNNRELFEAFVMYLNSIGKRIVFICFGDFAQIGPVVKNGSASDTIFATVSSSDLWASFVVLHLRENMRLSALRRGLRENATPAERDDLAMQLRYAESLLNISNNTAGPDCIEIEVHDDGHTKRIGLPLINYFVCQAPVADEDDNDDAEAPPIQPATISAVSEAQDRALAWLYGAPDVDALRTSFDTNMSKKAVVLTGTNKSVDAWNDKIQALNAGPIIECKSTDSFCEVDDDHGHLARNITDKAMATFNKTGVPPHTLRLKVHDVCIITRSIPALDLPTNSRVRILTITRTLVTALTVDERQQRRVFIPRIHFKFRLKYGQSFQLLRTQFPLRLAYAMTYNKSQGQTLGRALVDICAAPFAHGHTYVATSRVRSLHDISFFLTTDNLFTPTSGPHAGEAIPTLFNIVYQQILI
jgi:hypothetical protein